MAWEGYRKGTTRHRPQALGTPGKVVVVVVLVGTVGTTIVPDEVVPDDVEGLVTVILGLLAKLGWLRVSAMLNAIAPAPNSFTYEVDFMVILRKL